MVFYCTYMAYVRIYHESSVLTNGKVLIAGESINNLDALNTSESFDPSAGL